jgi:hypothetical protein
MGPLIPSAMSLAPEIGQWLFGPGGEQIQAEIARAARDVTGAGEDLAAQQVLARDPEAAAQFRLRLARVAAEQRQADFDGLAAQLAGTRGQAVSRARSGGLVQWAAAFVSAIVLLTFGIVMWAALTRALPAGSETILNMLLGTLAAMATSVVGYWLGSSAGSERKTDLLYNSTPSDAPPTNGAKS